MKFLDAIRRKRKTDPINLDVNQSRPAPDLTRIIKGLRYSTLDAKVVAQGIVLSILPMYAWLFQTNKSHFFVVYETKFLTSTPNLSLYPIEEEEMAQQLYETLRLQEVPYAQVFPNVGVSDA